MAQKNITFDIGGKTKEASGSYYDDATNTLVLKNVSVNNISLPNLPDGIAFVSGTTISSSGGAVNGKVVTWDATAGRWGFTDPTYVDVNIANPTIPASSDISGTFANAAPYIQVKSLSNVNTGNPLPVARGGTGLSAAAIPNGESLLVGNGSDPLTFITASNSSTKQALLSNGTGWELTAGPADISSSVEISIFTSSATWNKPVGTKAIRVLAQGGGGGGGSGANRSSDIACTGGSGGGAGGFIDTGIFIIDENSASVIVGNGGEGAIYPATNSVGIVGGAGYSSSFSNYVYVSGGYGGLGGALSATTVNGASSVVYGNNFIYDSFVYNMQKTNINGTAGGSSISGEGRSNYWGTSSATYGGPNGGGGGGGLIAGDITNYNGGSGMASDAKILYDFETLYDLANPSTQITLNGAAGLSSAVSKFGVNSLRVYNNGWARIPSYYFPSNYTVETWIYFSSLYNYLPLFTIPGETLYANANGSMFIDRHGAGTTGGTAAGVVTANTWRHVAIVSLNGSSTLYVNGTSVSTFITPIYNAYRNINIGKTEDGWTTYYGNAYYNDFRITNYSVYTANFTVPSNKFYFYYNNNKGTTSSLNGSSAFSSSVLPLLDTNISVNSQANNIFISSGGGGGASNNSSAGGLGGNGAWGSGGGGGGASANATSSLTQYDVETISLVHFNSNEQQKSKDYSIYNNIFNTGINSIVTSGSVGIPSPSGSSWQDGILISSPTSQLASGWNGSWVQPYVSITDNFTIESWMYLLNAGSGDASTKCYLLFGGYNAAGTQGILMGINSSNQIVIWASDGTAIQNTGNAILTVPYNSWNHFVLQKSGTSVTAYLNGTSSVLVKNSTTTNNQFGYGLGNTIYSQYAPNGYCKEFTITNRVKSAAEIQNYYSSVISGVSGSYTNPSSGIKQGGNGGNGYVAVISYKY